MNLNLQEVQEYVSLVKDIITALSALTVAVIATLGLQTWKKELKGRTEYELARRLLRAVYKARHAIHLVRNPFMYAGEIIQSLQEANIQVDQHDQRYNAISHRAVYMRRWQKVEDALTELQLDTFEAEVIWGQEASEKMRPLRKNVSTLFANIQLYLRQLEEPPGYTLDSETSFQRRQEIERVIYYDLGEDPTRNSFTVEITESVTQIEEYLRPHLNL